MNYLKGVDVSHYQGDIDWKGLKNDGISFAQIKATDGVSFHDPRFKTNVSDAQSAGILVGAYHFWRPTIDPMNQANNFLMSIQGLPLNLPPMLDIETPSGLKAPDYVHGVLKFLDEIEKSLDVIPIIYSGFYFINSLGNPKEFAKFPLWLASYNNDPKVPRPWTKWTFWQFTNIAKFTPNAASFDADYFAGSVDELTDLIKKPLPIQA